MLLEAPLEWSGPEAQLHVIQARGSLIAPSIPFHLPDSNRTVWGGADERSVSLMTLWITTVSGLSGPRTFIEDNGHGAKSEQIEKTPWRTVGLQSILYIGIEGAGVRRPLEIHGW